MNPKVSVIIPVYNVEQYLRQCLDSIVNQTYQNLQIILVDDGSTDQCMSICEEYLRKDKRIELIRKENGGLSDARNAGLVAATGEYLGFVDSDDYIACDMYEKLVEACVSNEADIAICRFRAVSDNGKFLTEDGQKNDLVLDNCTALKYYVKEYPECLITPAVWVKLFRRKLVEGQTFPKGKLCEDIVYTTEAFWNAEKIIYIDKSYYFYRIREGSIMNNNNALVKRVMDEWEQYENRINFLSNVKSSGIVVFCQCKLYVRLLQRYYECFQNKSEEIEQLKTKIAQRMKTLKKSAWKVWELPISIREKIGVTLSLFSLSVYMKFRKIISS